ncbi:MAG: hypothetical protein RLZZ500_515 [Bacteroidota bacterium]|jgi:ubiquinone biosynthesis protein Coq4
MKTKKTTLKTSKVIALSDAAKAKIDTVAHAIQGKELFTDKIAAAKKTLSELKSLPL